ncbi:hypothetical protein M101_4922 [Bacteroides fragilis str. 1007-1-F |nr:hypothetical protein M101_4922 [Bacteroides fragilis str. 1007-1-F \
MQVQEQPSGVLGQTAGSSLTVSSMVLQKNLPLTDKSPIV